MMSMELACVRPSIRTSAIIIRAFRRYRFLNADIINYYLHVMGFSSDASTTMTVSDSIQFALSEMGSYTE